jgi:hypothetical protein
MVTLEQVKLLETKVIRAVEYVERMSRENSQLQGKLDSYEKRVGELETVLQKVKEEQDRIEEGIFSALNLLNKVEDAIEKNTPPADTRRTVPADKEKEAPRQKKESPPDRPGLEFNAPANDAGAGDPVNSGADSGAGAAQETPDALFSEAAPGSGEPSAPGEAPSRGGTDSAELDIF